MLHTSMMSHRAHAVCSGHVPPLMASLRCRPLDPSSFAVQLSAKNAQRLISIKDPGQCLN